MSSHLKKHVLFYLGLAQLIAAFLAADGDLPGRWVKYALGASALLTIIIKYVQANLPDDPVNPTEPAQPAPSQVKP